MGTARLQDVPQMVQLRPYVPVPWGRPENVPLRPNADVYLRDVPGTPCRRCIFKNILNTLFDDHQHIAIESCSR